MPRTVGAISRYGQIAAAVRGVAVPPGRGTGVPVPGCGGLLWTVIGMSADAMAV